MKFVKMFGLLGMVVASLVGMTSSASATTVTAPTGTSYTGSVHGNSGIITLHGAVTITCAESTITGNISTHSSTTTAHGPLEVLTFWACDTNDVTVLSAGSLSAHTEPNSPSSTNATLTSTGAAILIHITSLGLTCEYTTYETDIGTLTSSHTTGGHAVLDIDSAIIPRTGGSFFCGSSGELTGSYTITTPSALYVG
jgi:hypothetical protein